MSATNRPKRETISGDSALCYTETLTYGHYSDLRQFARKEASKTKRRKSEDNNSAGKTSACTGACRHGLRWWRHVLFGRYTQDWIFLTLLGFTVAIFSFMIDVIVEKIQIAHRWAYREVDYSIVSQYFVWIVFPIVFICFSAGFTHIVGPTAIGSGIPEVKTIMKGVILKEYLTLQTLVAKVVGLSASLGSGLPLGKVGPFVHMASVSAAVLSQMFSAFRNELENESRKVDILTAASAVGVSCTFAAPVGGVLFSIEATATYFAVRNYWRGFYSAICGAIMFRLLALWFSSEETLTVLFKTNLRKETAYDVYEMLPFVAVGAICGILGALFVYVHKNIVLFIRRRKKLNTFLQRYRLVYPTVVTLVIMSVLFPAGFGKYMAGGLSLREAANQMFDNRTWSTHEPNDFVEARFLEVWKGPLDNVYVTLFLFFVMRFWMCAIATTLPVPCGIFIPAFSMGASVGRLFGEGMAACFPYGIRGKAILPGAYAIVGAATFSAAVTHTVSPAVIVFELTGHMAHILPCVIAVMVACAVANFFQPSAYDAMIEIKKLPFLPATIDPDICNAHQVNAEEFMVRDVYFLSSKSTYSYAWELLQLRSVRAYPLVDSEDNMMLRGSIQRKELKRVISALFTSERKHRYLSRKLQSKDPSEDKTELQPLKRSHQDIHDKLEEGNENKDMEYRVRFLDSDAEDEGDLAPDVEDLGWKAHELSQPINFEECYIDPAPFQFSAKTSLYKVHWLFSLLSLHHAYVTDGGRLVGIVSMDEVRKAIQGFLNTIPKKRKTTLALKQKPELEVETTK